MAACGIVGEFKENNELILVDKKPVPPGLSNGCMVLNMDITDHKAVYDKLSSLNPDVIIHAAAYTDVDGCEKNRDDAFKINAVGARNVALACQRFDTVMLYVSTDYVFDGRKKEPYKENDTPAPLNVYGESKHMGEGYVKELINKHYIVRSSAFFGTGGRNFVTDILRLSKENEALRVVEDQVTSPTYTRDFSRAIKNLIGTGLYGTWHITNSGSCSWHEFAVQILKNANIRKEITKINSLQLDRAAKRPAYSALGNYLWELQGFEPLRNWKEALADYMKEETII